MQKKKVLFIMPSMFIGGAERSLLGLLDAFDYSKYDVNLFLYRHEGEFMDYIPKKVNLLPEMKQYATFDVPIKKLLLSSQFAFGCARIIGKIAKQFHSKISREPIGVWMNMQYISRFLLPLLPNIPGEYDLAVMFLGVGDVLAKKVKAKTKITWNHTDYTILNPDKKYDLKVFKNIDYVASVSEEATEQLLKVYPSIKAKAITIENILSQDFLYKQAEEEIFNISKTESSTILLSIGRFTYAKNFDNIPMICKLLIEKNIPVVWYLIGYGGDENLIKEKINEAGMQKHVIMLGKKTNPYPYIKACDIYVQPSRFEGKCVTVREAQILDKPVIITNYATSSSQLKDGYDGMVVPMDNDGCAGGIANVINNKELLRRLIDNTQKTDYTNKEEIKKIYILM